MTARRPKYDSNSARCALLIGFACLLVSGQNRPQPSIEFTRVPAAGRGDAALVTAIEGRVQGALPGQAIVLYAKGGDWWWVQPFVEQPFTEILPDSRWKNTTHPGTAYAALLVDARYSPPAKLSQLPAKGGLVLAVATVNGVNPALISYSSPKAPSVPTGAADRRSSGVVLAAERALPSIELTTVPGSSQGSAKVMEDIEGTVKGATPGQRIVLYALSGGVWWVQPLADKPFTDIQPDSHWKGTTHPGTAYAALLTDPQYAPPVKFAELPERGGLVTAVAVAKGAQWTPPPPAKVIQFSGYPWRVRSDPGVEGGSVSFYDPANVSVDSKGLLHLTVVKRDNKWTSAQVTLSRNMGYGSYRFVVRDTSRLEPAAVFIMGPSGKMDIEVTRMGRPEAKNGQYVIKPYIVPANAFRFTSPPGILSYWMIWQPGKATFRTVRGSSSTTGGGIVTEHTFTSGIQPIGGEGMILNAYTFADAVKPLHHGFEVIVEKFEFLP